MVQLHIVVRYEETFDRIVEVTAAETLIGRRDSCGIWLPDHMVSREHAVLVKSGDSYRIRDLGSRNGTLLHGHPLLMEETLSDGSDVRIGRYCLRMHFRIATAIRESANAEDLTKSSDGSLPRNFSPGFEKLTPAQQRVYSLFLEGMLEKEVALALGISIHTVHWHAKAIYSVLSVSTRAELISRGLAVRDQG